MSYVTAMNGKGARGKEGGGQVPRLQVNVVWHKQGDLRLHDSEPVSLAHLAGLPVIHLHVFDRFWFGRTRVGGFQKTGSLRAEFWRECVEDLRGSLRLRGQDLVVRWGSTVEAFEELAQHFIIMSVFTHTEVCSEELAIEQQVLRVLKRAQAKGGGAQEQLVRCWGYTLHHIDDLPSTTRGPPEKWITSGLSFGQFKKDIQGTRIRKVGFEWQARCKASGFALAPPPYWPTAFCGEVPLLTDLGYCSEDLELVEAARAEQRSAFVWRGGESHALARLEALIWGRHGLRPYVGTTDWSAGAKCDAGPEQTSKLSPYLAFGCISPRLVHDQILEYEKSQGRCKGSRGLINSMLWRDFYRFIVRFAWGDRMFHLFGPVSCGSKPGGHRTPQKWCCFHYSNIFGGSDPRMWTWQKDEGKLQKWTSGATGYPFVDASMKELRATGYMHHLKRETVGWFFVRDLQLDWRLAAEWFESCLVDYDCVLNWGNWVYFILTQLPSREDDRQGGGPKYTLPYYSPYLMTSQVLIWAEEHDPHSNHIYRWIPQLRGLPASLARMPWCLSTDDLGVHSAASDSTNAEDDYASILAALGSEAGSIGWACEACTLENLATSSRCEACGTPQAGLTSAKIDAGALQRNSWSRRAAVRTAGASQSAAAAIQARLGVYGKPPVVPPPINTQATVSECENCGLCGAGAEMEDDSSFAFYCGTCWLSWAAMHTTENFMPKINNSPAESSIARGWALVPKHALPKGASQFSYAGGTASISYYEQATEVTSSNPPEILKSSKAVCGNRWKRRGELACSRELTKAQGG